MPNESLQGVIIAEPEKALDSLKGKRGTVLKLFLLLFLVIGIYFTSEKELSAAPSNGTSFPPKGRAEFGYEYFVMHKRPLDRSYGNLKAQGHFYTVSIGVFDWLCLDGKIGLEDVRQKGGTHLPKLEYRAGFAGGYGFRIKAFDHPQSGIRIIGR